MMLNRLRKKLMQTYSVADNDDNKINKRLLISFTFEGAFFSSISYAIVTLAMAFWGNALSKHQPIWIVPVYWGICGGIGGLFWGLLCALRAKKWLADGIRLGLSTPWGRVAGGSMNYALVFGVLMAALSFFLPFHPIIEVHPAIRIILFTGAGIWVGHKAAPSALTNYMGVFE